MSDQSSGGQADRISAEIAALASLGIRDLKSRWRAWYDTGPVCGELLILGKSVIRHTQDRRSSVQYVRI